jgi:acetyl esterase/lipase
MSTANYPIHPDFKILSGIHPPLSRKTIPIIQKAMGLLFHQQRTDRTVRVEHIRIPAAEGRSVRALLYVPRNGLSGGFLLFCHGGGYAFPAAPYHYRLARIYARGQGAASCSRTIGLPPAIPSPPRRKTALQPTAGFLSTRMGPQQPCAATAPAEHWQWR